MTAAALETPQDDIRKLVTVEQVISIDPIQNADAIEVATIRGWKIVTKKGEFSLGDKVLYFELDCLLPISDPRFEFLAVRGTKTAEDGTVAHRLKTARLRGVYSQGLALPLADFPEVTNHDNAAAYLSGELDAAELLNIRKYEVPLPAGTNIIGDFPSRYARKTDAERSQNLVSKWDVLLENGDWSATEKIDGTSLTAIKDEGGELRIAGRNYELEVGVGYHGQVVAASGLADRMVPGEALQGELAGPGIQKNTLNLAERAIFVFNYTRDGTVLPRELWPTWLFDGSAPHIYPVPVYHDLELMGTTEETLAKVDGIRSIITPGRLAEGVVWFDSSMNEDVAKVLDGRNIFKTISNKWLGKYED